MCFSCLLRQCGIFSRGAGIGRLTIPARLLVNVILPEKCTELFTATFTDSDELVTHSRRLGGYNNSTYSLHLYFFPDTKLIVHP